MSRPRPFQRSKNSARRVSSSKTDVADEAQVADAIQQTVEHFGGLDILVNNAGIHIPGGAQEISIADWDKVVGVNLRCVFVATKLAIPHLKQSKFGRIIQIASVHAYGGGAGPAYAPAKAAVVNMVRDTALEIGQFGITVNAICPGYIETAIQDYLTPEQIEEALEKTALPPASVYRETSDVPVSFSPPTMRNGSPVLLCSLMVGSPRACRRDFRIPTLCRRGGISESRLLTDR